MHSLAVDRLLEQGPRHGPGHELNAGTRGGVVGR
jgi:hypothetical protein